MASYACREHNVTDCLVCANTALRTRLAEVEKRLKFNSRAGKCEACEATFNAPCVYHQGEIAGEEKLQSRVTALEDALRRYGWHQPYCKRADLGDDMRRDVECNCGLSDARRRAVLTPASTKEAPDEY